MTEDWIKDAFEKAQKRQEKAASLGEELSEFLENNTEAILDSWRAVTDEESSMRVVELLCRDKKLCDTINDMCTMFCIAGYLYCARKNNL